MIRLILSENIQSGIKGLRVAMLPISTILFALMIFCLNFSYGQMTTIPDGPGGVPSGGMPDAYLRTSPAQNGSGMEQQIPPQNIPDAANLPPTLGGGQQAGLPTSGRQDDSEYLKSVQNESHPLNDFLVVLRRQPGTATPEKEVYLYEVLSGVTSPTQRRELIKAYWNLSEKMMHIHVRMAQRQRLQTVQTVMRNEQLPTDEVELALQLVAQQELALDLEFVQTQYRFLDLQSKIPTLTAYRWRSSYGTTTDGFCDCDETISQPTSTVPTQNVIAQKPEDRPLPIPADFPLAVPYNTKFEELKKTRTLSQKSLLLNQTIPLQYQAIVARTAAKQTAMSWCDTVLTKNRQAPVAQIEALAQEEMALISTIIEYNHQVDEYVIETFGTNIPEKQLLAAILVLPKRPASETPQYPNRMPSTFSE